MDKALETQLNNIGKRTGKTILELTALVKGCGLTKHGEIRDMPKRELGMGHGDANTVAHMALKAEEPAPADVLGEIHSGPKAALRPIHDRLMAGIGKFGDFEISPKRGM